MPPLLGMLLMLGLFGVFLPAALCFDRIVRREYEHHPDAWQADGRPHGFFFHPEEERTPVSSNLAFNRLVCKLWCSTPPWLRADDQALRWLVPYRVFCLLWTLGIVGLGVVVTWLTRSS